MPHIPLQGQGATSSMDVPGIPRFCHWVTTEAAGEWTRMMEMSPGIRARTHLRWKQLKQWGFITSLRSRRSELSIKNISQFIP